MRFFGIDKGEEAYQRIGETVNKVGKKDYLAVYKAKLKNVKIDKIPQNCAKKWKNDIFKRKINVILSLKYSPYCSPLEGCPGLVE